MSKGFAVQAWGLVCGSPRTRVRPRHGVISLSNLGEENQVNLGSYWAPGLHRVH